MEKDQYHNYYSKLSDTQILDEFEAVVYKAKDDPTIENTSRLTAILKVKQERGLDIVTHLRNRQKKESKQHAKTILKSYRKEGWKMLFFGAVVLAIGLALTASTGGKGIFYGAIVIGALFLLAGIFFLVSGAGMGVFAWWRLRK